MAEYNGRERDLFDNQIDEMKADSLRILLALIKANKPDFVKPGELVARAVWYADQLHKVARETVKLNVDVEVDRLRKEEGVTREEIKQHQLKALVDGEIAKIQNKLSYTHAQITGLSLNKLRSLKVASIRLIDADYGIDGLDEMIEQAVPNWRAGVRAVVREVDDETARRMRK